MGGAGMFPCAGRSSWDQTLSPECVPDYAFTLSSTMQAAFLTHILVPQIESHNHPKLGENNALNTLYINIPQ